jgi:hypothetical protein
MDNLKIWNALKQPPPSALKTIQAGRLKGKSDISPQWRYQAMTEQFGPCGIGWKYEIPEFWTDNGADNLVCAFAKVLLYFKHDDVWSEPIPGIGGSMLVAKESSGPYTSDEAYKMAVTDALSVAMKMIGVAADVYMGLWDGSKYKDTPQQKESQKQDSDSKEMSSKQWNFIKKISVETQQMTESELIDMIKWKAQKENLEPRHWKMTKFLLPEDKFQEVFIEYSEHMIQQGQEDDIPY